MSKRKRRRFVGKEKIRIIKRHLLEGEAISEICKIEDITPGQFYQWQNQLFEKGEAAFSNQKERSSELDRKQQEIEELEAKLAKKNEILSEAVEAMVTAKKLNGDR